MLIRLGFKNERIMMGVGSVHGCRVNAPHEERGVSSQSFVNERYAFYIQEQVNTQNAFAPILITQECEHAPSCKKRKRTHTAEGGHLPSPPKPLRLCASQSHHKRSWWVCTEHDIVAHALTTAVAAAAGLITWGGLLPRSWSHFRFRVERIPTWTSASRVHRFVLVLEDWQGARNPPPQLVLGPARGCEYDSSSDMKVLKSTPLRLMTQMSPAFPLRA